MRYLIIILTLIFSGTAWADIGPPVRIPGYGWPSAPEMRSNPEKTGPISPPQHDLKLQILEKIDTLHPSITDHGFQSPLAAASPWTGKTGPLSGCPVPPRIREPMKNKGEQMNRSEYVILTQNTFPPLTIDGEKPAPQGLIPRLLAPTQSRMAK